MRKLASLLFGIFIITNTFAQETPSNIKRSWPAYYSYDQDLLSTDFHRNRRAALRDSLPANSAAFFFSNPVRNRSNDVYFEYHQDPNFFYLTGFKEPHSLLIIFKEPVQLGDSSTSEILFVQERNVEREAWDGRRLGAKRVTSLGIETGVENKSFADIPIDFGQFSKIFHLALPDDLRDDKRDRGDLYSLIRHFKRRTDTLKTQGKVDKNRLQTYMNSMREKKLPEEIRLMQKAIDVTCEAHNELMKLAAPGMTEYQAEAVVEYIFKAGGAEQPGFPSILGGGENSCILHYTSNRKPLSGEHLLVADIGAEYHGYTADITRTIPIDGEFSEEEKIIYELVLKAQMAAIDKCYKGNKFWDPHNAAQKVIEKGLLSLGITKRYYHAKKYFRHGTSHYLGLDVHDAGRYASLQPGNVITVEPGIYIPEGSDCDPKWWNIGVRIEDDILITDSVPLNMSKASPRTVQEIETMMKEESAVFIAK